MWLKHVFNREHTYLIRLPGAGSEKVSISKPTMHAMAMNFNQKFFVSSLEWIHIYYEACHIIFPLFLLLLPSMDDSVWMIIMCFHWHLIYTVCVFVCECMQLATIIRFKLHRKSPIDPVFISHIEIKRERESEINKNDWISVQSTLAFLVPFHARYNRTAGQIQ